MKRRKLTNSISVRLCMVLGLLLGFSFGEAQAEEYKLKIPFGLEESAVVIPADNPLTKEKVELGRLLFFDKRLSADNTIACANCHMAKFAFTDGKPVSTGIRGQVGSRKAPPILNAAWPLVLLPAVLGALYVFVIKREERYLRDAFGQRYVEYSARVRRWI